MILMLSNHKNSPAIILNERKSQLLGWIIDFLEINYEKCLAPNFKLENSSILVNLRANIKIRDT